MAGWEDWSHPKKDTGLFQPARRITKRQLHSSLSLSGFLGYWMSMPTRLRRLKGADIEEHLHWRFPIFILFGCEYQYGVMYLQYWQQQQQQQHDCIELSVRTPKDHCCTCFWLISSCIPVHDVLLYLCAILEYPFTSHLIIMILLSWALLLLQCVNI